jgi:hypothetical protein
MAWTIDELEQLISALKTSIMDHSTTGIESYTVGNRQVKYKSDEERLVALGKFEAEKDRMIRTQKMKLGEGNPNKILTRF